MALLQHFQRGRLFLNAFHKNLFCKGIVSPSFCNPCPCNPKKRYFRTNFVLVQKFEYIAGERCLICVQNTNPYKSDVVLVLFFFHERSSTSFHEQESGVRIRWVRILMKFDIRQPVHEWVFTIFFYHALEVMLQSIIFNSVLFRFDRLQQRLFKILNISASS